VRSSSAYLKKKAALPSKIFAAHQQAIAK